MEQGLAIKVQMGDRLEDVTLNVLKTVLMENGWSILEQRVPRRAYVVLRDKSEELVQPIARARRTRNSILPRDGRLGTYHNPDSLGGGER